MQGELVQDATKKNQYVNTVDCNRSFQIRNPGRYYPQADFGFSFPIAQVSIASQILHYGRCLHGLYNYIITKIQMHT